MDEKVGSRMVSKGVLAAAAMVLGLLCAFPPWTHTVRRGTAYGLVSTPAGHSFVLAPPEPEPHEREMTTVSLDVARLLVECVAFVALTFGLTVGVRVAGVRAHIKEDLAIPRNDFRGRDTP